MSKTIRHNKKSVISKYFLEEATVDILNETMDALDELSSDYWSIKPPVDPNYVDEIKRTFLSYYSNFSYYMAEVYSKKGTNHIYLEDLRRQIRQEHVDFLMESSLDPKYSVTRAEKDIDSNPLCKEDMLTLDSFKRALLEYEKRDKFYQLVLASMTQSISIVRKDMEANNFLS